MTFQSEALAFSGFLKECHSLHVWVVMVMATSHCVIVNCSQQMRHIYTKTYTMNIKHDAMGEPKTSASLLPFFMVKIANTTSWNITKMVSSGNNCIFSHEQSLDWGVLFDQNDNSEFNNTLWSRDGSYINSIKLILINKCIEFNVNINEINTVKYMMM